MTGFGRNSEGRATLGGAPIADLVREAGTKTPAYVYDLDAIEAEVRALVTAFGDAPHLVAYAVKANTAGPIVRRARAAGAGADVVSGAELEVALSCGIATNDLVMSGVAKTDAEIDRAIASGILAIQIESFEEIDRVAARARAAAKSARVSVRINPSVEIDSHAHVATGHDDAKFGMPAKLLPSAWEKMDAIDRLEPVGVSTHVGSMLADVGPYVASARAVCAAARARRASGRALEFVDFGGGFGIAYGAETPKPPGDFARAAVDLLRAERLDDLRLVIEPGRAIVGAHGVLVASVIQGKTGATRKWAFVDAAMNDLLRPALYGTRHRIEPLDSAPSAPEWRVAGPVCESADDFGDHPLGEDIPSAVVIRDVGAYGFVMSSEYNGRARPAEIFVSGGKVETVFASPGADAWVRSRLGD